MFSIFPYSTIRHFIVTNCSRRIQSDKIQVEKLGNVATIGINIPENKNILEEKSYLQLCDTLKEIEKDNTISACALYGIGGNFCTGCSNDFVPDPHMLVGSISKPLVAGITGYATDFGFELALLCDLRVIENTAQIGFNSIPRHASKLFYERLSNCVGLSVSLDLCLTARNLSAKEAFEYGVAQRIVDCGTGIGQAVQLAKTVGKFPVQFLRKSKEDIYSSLSLKKLS